MRRLKHDIKKHKVKLVIILILLIAYYFCLPKQLFNNPTTTVLESREGYLLGARIADDGQWRFPVLDSIPEKFKTCLIYFEDEYFYKHPGFNPVSIFKALKQNITSRRIKRGGSTITQQTIRLSRRGKPRTYFEKLKEFILATRLELRESKETILKLYSSHAPFGGNVVGLEAASWRYFGRQAKDLSWAEHATLAVLPNAPSLIYPGKNQDKLLKKRNLLLKKLRNHNIIDSLTYNLSILESLPQRPYPLPQIAPHLLQTLAIQNKGQRLKTSIRKKLQQQTNTIAKNHYNSLKQNEIYNLSILILDVKTRQVLSYVGNSSTDKMHQKDVDIVTKPRSTGSILKPFLYAAMLDSGELLPHTLVADIPTQFGSYVPKNFNKEYDGAVTASRALSRSLNVPAVRMLQEFGLDRFYHYLKQLQLKDLKQHANHYGLSLILGGAESNLWDLCKSYAALSSTLNHFHENSGQYFSHEFIEPTFSPEPLDFGTLSFEKTLFDAASIYLTFESLKKVNRPEENELWEFFDSSKQIAWKTGTSFGFRDAWAIGTTKDYVVGVWVGNADGEGRPGLVGIQAAAPILFDVFTLLPNSEWFSKPFDEMQQVVICSKSGYRASRYCLETKEEFIQQSGLKTKACPYHVQVNLNKTKLFQVNSSCASVHDMVNSSWFVLPPLMAYYYKTKNPFYKPLPPFKENCATDIEKTLSFIYPNQANSVFYLPKNFNGTPNELILKVAHKTPRTKVFWYLNNQFIGRTQQIHDIAIQPKAGKYLITVVDELGNEIKRWIEILE